MSLNQGSVMARVLPRSHSHVKRAALEPARLGSDAGRGPDAGDHGHIAL